jgi:transcriptional regulator with XRE-family HTH domain
MRVHTVSMSVNEDALYAHIGKQIRASRRELNVTQSQLAKRVGVTRTSIANIEAGTQKLPLHLLYRICEALKVEASELLPTVVELITSTEGKVVNVDGHSQQMAPKTALFVRAALEDLSYDESNRD